MTEQNHETPVVVLMPQVFLNYLLDIVNVPETLNGAAVLRKATLIRYLQEFVTVDEYNNAIVKRVIAIQAEQRATPTPVEAVVPPVTSEPELVEPKTPVAANSAASFKPHRLRIAEEADERAKAELEAEEKENARYANLEAKRLASNKARNERRAREKDRKKEQADAANTVTFKKETSNKKTPGNSGAKQAKPLTPAKKPSRNKW